MDIKETVPVRFKCRCSRETIMTALGRLDKKSLAELAQDEVTEAHCQFCNSTYTFAQTEIQALLDKKQD